MYLLKSEFTRQSPEVILIINHSVTNNTQTREIHKILYLFVVCYLLLLLNFTVAEL